MLKTIAPEFEMSDKIGCSSSYINNKGEKPPIGVCFSTTMVSLDKFEPSAQWKFNSEDEDLRGQMRYLKYCEDEFIIITHE